MRLPCHSAARGSRLFGLHGAESQASGAQRVANRVAHRVAARRAAIYLRRDDGNAFLVTEYARRLGLFDAVMVTVGGIIGGGIFLNPAVVAQRVHTASLILAVWILGGAIACAGAMTFAELGGRRPQAGGGYVYLKEAFGPLPAFLYGWTFLVIINTGGMAAVAVTFARYTADLGGMPAGAVRPIAIAAIVLLTIVNCLGV